jgi:hypothetical protein
VSWAIENRLRPKFNALSKKAKISKVRFAQLKKEDYRLSETDREEWMRRFYVNPHFITTTDT